METLKASHGFRKKIKDHLPFWQKQGFVTGEQAQQLTSYYRLDTLKSEITHLTLTGVYLIGVFLIGIGVISFIAAHWTALGRGVKVAMLLTAMLAAHGTGYCLWHVSGRFPKLGHALVVLGTLIFGANIGLMAQIFHVYENPANGYLAWTLGAVAAAYALLSVPNALIAITTSMICFFVRASGEGHAPLWFPFAIIAVFVPLVYLCRSRWVLAGVLIALGLSIPFLFVSEDGSMAGSMIVPLFAAVGFTAWGVLHQRSERTAEFTLLCKVFGFAIGFGILYLLSFWDLAAELQDEFSDFFTNDGAVLLTAAAICGSAAMLSVFALIYAKLKFDAASNLILLALSAMIVIALAGGAAYTLVVAVHILALLLSANLIRLSIQTQSRRLFWAGIWLPGLIILSRTLEYDTELLIKAAVFAACGIGVIVAGVMFERQLKRKGVDHV